MEKNYQLLNQFQGMKCEVGFRSTTDSTLNASYIYHSFNYHLEDDLIYLEDARTNEFTYLGLNEISEFKNLNDDLYNDVVTFKTNGYIIDICTLEEPFQYPKCHKCGNEIYIPEAVTWHVIGWDCYENPYDGDSNVVNGLNFCSGCIQEFIGSIDSFTYM